MEASKRSIPELFGGYKQFEVPFFQRAYVWDEEQWERLLSDMEFISATQEPYFIGSLILKQVPTNSGSEVDRRVIIDGQQRLTTLSVFLKVWGLLTGREDEIKRHIRLTPGEQAPAIAHSLIDTTAFKAVMDQKSPTDIESNNNIIRAYQYFKNNIDPDAIHIHHVLTRLTFVAIDLGPDEDEQQIFDTINSLGVRLTTGELLKNHLFDQESVELYRKQWLPVFEADEDLQEYWNTLVTAGRLQRSHIDLFFWAFLQIRMHGGDIELSQQHKDRYSKVGELFQSYKHYMKHAAVDRDQLIGEIGSYANAYRSHFDTSITKEKLPAEAGLERIAAIVFGLETTTAIPYVLYVLRNVIEASERNAIFGILEAYLMRRRVCRSNNKNYNQLFTEQLIGNHVLTASTLRRFIEQKAETTEYFPGDEELRNGFHESVLTNKQAAGVLYLIETGMREESLHSTDLLGLQHYSLEHIMPKKWRNHWDNVESEEMAVERDRKLLTLGNLAIISGGLNSSIRDSDWSTKKTGANGQHGLKRYATGLETVAKYLDLDVWNERTMEDRAEELFLKAVRIWTL